ncbi:MAG: CehA/McbA family metallohydrolase, partial [Acidobacteriota bacterium]|nr:CehA/McbA family metallohydrolase [Acidobacteriota bacterium]
HRAYRKVTFLRVLTCLVCLLLMACAAAAPGAARQRWYRGNTHTHTTNSDGDSSPRAVADWYKSNGYDFLFITDHDRLTGVAELNAALGAGGDFLVLGGIEITDEFRGLPVHLTALDPRRLTLPQHGGSVLDTLQRDVDAIRAAGGVACVAHPNLQYAVSAADLKALRNYSLFELFNALDITSSHGDATHPSVEWMWDEVLSTGKVLYGVAADDTHSLAKNPRWLPGRAWVVVRATSLTPAAIVGALERGDFYASTGVKLRDLQITNAGITITTEETSSDCGDFGPCLQNPTVEFIGRHGRVLMTTTASPAHYRFAGDELYVRARITDPFGRTAWTQPVFLAGLPAAQVVLNAAIPDRNLARAWAVAPDTIAVVLGTGFAVTTAQAHPQPGRAFALELNGTRVNACGRPAPIFFASPTQVNFLIPPDAAPGVCEVVITNPQGAQSKLSLTVQEVAPALFTQDGTGGGEAVTYKMFREMPTIFGGDGPRRVIVFATGLGRAGVTATANGQPAAIEAVVLNPTLPGLTQIHLALPAHLAPGPVTVIIRANGGESNAVTVRL